MKQPSPILMNCYRIALALFPLRFRLQYEQQILQTLRDSHLDQPAGLVKFWFRAFCDLVKSAATEGILLARGKILKQPVWFHSFALGLTLTLLGGAAAVTMQQMLRRGANEPQAEMADFYAGEILSGKNPQNSIPTIHVDLGRDLQPFVIFYDANGVPQKSTGYLDESIPSPPPGVLEYARIHGSDTITWQPRHGVRIAAVALYVPGAHPGYLLAGRSLRLTEEYESLLRRMVFVGWFVVMSLLTLGAVLFNRAQRAATTP